MNQHLFLFGSGPPINPQLSKIISDLSLNKKGPVCILFIERDGWKEYMEKVTKPLKSYGVTHFIFLPLLATPIVDVVSAIESCSAIIILGGDTNLYADRLADTAISKTIKNSYMNGIPVVGFSAGALISPYYCIISPKDNVLQEFQVRKGLNLISNIGLAVHLTEWNDEQHLLKIAEHYPNIISYGIDENTGIYFKNDRLFFFEGKGVYQVVQSKIVRLSNDGGSYDV